ncbi:ASCH domain-containing protein [uncultured Corynebacterium sp.]|uniref:ASCH domain-containing protein n=1 Tax=uncultured Corynebacterium sp. TaxID=159447 RepID=UPI0025E5D7CE|nr:ASCH domain-containing protein [uncultured Corynebacterium sp.]
MITHELRELAASAKEHAARFNDGNDHTVSAALLTASGRHVLGLNAFHFLGGPCGEVSALAAHAATCPEDPVRAVVAVYGPTGSVIPPCGKCRQVLFDLDPGIQCVVRTNNGFEAPTVAELLPNAFDWRNLGGDQRVYMWEGYEEAIRSGAKRQTIRVDDPFREGGAQLVFEKESGVTVTMPARIVSVATIQRSSLTEEHAKLDGFASLGELHEALDAHYPGLAPEDPVDVVSFEIG